MKQDRLQEAPYLIGVIAHMAISHRLFWTAALLVPILTFSACSTTKRTAFGERVYFPNTAAYQRKAQTFALTEQQARERLIEHLKTHSEDRYEKYLAAIVGNCFLFSGARKADVDLRGYYVDGQTGAITFRDEFTTGRYVPCPITFK